MKKFLLALILFIFVLGACQAPNQSPTQTFSPTPEEEESEAFELYLVINNQLKPADLDRYELDELRLADVPLLVTEDFEYYNWEEHTFFLTEEAYARLIVAFSGGIPMSGVPFLIISNGERIYAGAFWSPASSLSFDGVVILQPLDPAGSMMFIRLGYPTPDAFTGEDPRDDPRLKQAFENAGVLDN